MPCHIRYIAGITLIEALFVVAVAAILFGFASSSVSAAVNAARSNNGLSRLLADLTMARSAAASASHDVVPCPSSDGSSCMSGDHWESGWIAFQPLHAGSDREPTDPIVLRQSRMQPKVHLVSTTGRTRVRFQPSGGNPVAT
jgi:type IV fimbrial biogenesis protein FimT